MPLRKSPRLTPALIEANRRNARKSTGPRTSAGKQRIAQNAVRDGFYAGGFLESLSRQSLARQFDFSRLYAALVKAMFKGPETTVRVLPVAIGIWRAKRWAERQVRKPEFRRWVAAHGGFLPPPLRLLRSRKGPPHVTVTLCLRPGRSAACGGVGRMVQWDGRGAVHVAVLIYRSAGDGLRRFGVAPQRTARLVAAAHPNEPSDAGPAAGLGGLGGLFGRLRRYVRWGSSKPECGVE
ncbi:MAG TPA: hypothetical protein VL523_06585 [Terriglobia bacterium]|nr:hypothetical protein [Terriglobia bacterium]